MSLNKYFYFGHIILGGCDVVMDQRVSAELERDSNARVSKDIKSLTYIYSVDCKYLR